MKLFENMEELGGTVSDAIQHIVNEMFQEELDEEQIDEIVKRLSLSDLLALDTAYSEGNKEEVSEILGPLPTMEYSMGLGRQPTSAASNNPRTSRQMANQQRKQPGTQNTVNTNRNYSGGVQNGVTTQNNDDEDNPDAVMVDDEPIEEAGTPDHNTAAGRYNDIFHHGDPVIDDQGRTGEIRGQVDDQGYVDVEFYNYPAEKMPIDRLEYNDYADSDEEEHDLRLAMGDDDYDRMHGDLGYNDDDEDDYYEEQIEEDTDYDGRKQYFYDVGKELAGMLGMTIELKDYSADKHSRHIKYAIDGQDFLIKQKWKHDGSFSKPVTQLIFDGDYVNLGRFAIWWGKANDYAEDLHPSLEKLLTADPNIVDESVNVVDMVKWLQRRAGIN